MKIDRRSFLSFVIGGAAGTALSPLPWKLTDDMSIWSQNWPWTPVPLNGEVSYLNSVCTLCPGRCGITVRKIEDRVVKIDGTPGHPVNDGGICGLGLSGIQLLYSPNRIATPLKRVGKRGEGRWQKISYQKAISEVVAKLGELREKEQAHTIAALTQSDQGTVAKLLERFLTVYGSPNFLRMPSIQDTYELTLHLMNGAQASAGFDFENSDFVVSFGSGIIEGWGSPVRMFRANTRLRQSGGKVVQVESRLSVTAAKSNQWIAVNPGTETALALGMASVIIDKSLYKKDFINNNTFGFNDWTDKNGNTHEGFRKYILKAYPPEKVSKTTGVDKNTIFSLAESFARAGNPLAICGSGQGRTPGAVREFMAVHALNALVGNIDGKGGIWAVPEVDYINWPTPEMDQAAANGIQKGRLDEAGSERFPASRYLVDGFVKNINKSTPYPINMLFVSGANPLHSLPETESVKNAFAKIPFVVSFSSYMDETAEQADLILPNHIYLERYEDVPQPLGLQKQVLGLTRPVVPPQHNTRHTGDIVIAMAKGMGGSIAGAFPWKNYESCLEVTLGRKLNILIEKGYWVNGRMSKPQMKSFDTASGKFEFAAVNEADDTKTLLPGFDPVKPKGDIASYPLVLIPYDSMRLANSHIGDPPFLIKTVEDVVLKEKDIFVEINPETAKRLKLSEGRLAELSTPMGTVKVRVHLYDGIGPEVIALPRGLGHTAYDKYLAGKGINFNTLIDAAPDPDSGLNAAWGIRAKLSKA